MKCPHTLSIDVIFLRNMVNEDHKHSSNFYVKSQWLNDPMNLEIELQKGENVEGIEFQ